MSMGHLAQYAYVTLGTVNMWDTWQYACGAYGTVCICDTWHTISTTTEKLLQLKSVDTT